MCPQKTTIKQQMEPFSIVEKSTAKVTFPKCFLCLLWGSKNEDFIEKLYVNQIFQYYSNTIKKINKMQNKSLKEVFGPIFFSKKPKLLSAFTFFFFYEIEEKKKEKSECFLIKLTTKQRCQQYLNSRNWPISKYFMAVFTISKQFIALFVFLPK